MANFYFPALDESISQSRMMSSLNINNTADDFVVSLTDGNDIMFQNIWDRFNLPVRKFIYQMCGNYEITEELAQETFVRIFKGIGKYRGETKFSSWVFGIAKNVVLENLYQSKKNSRHVGIEQADSFKVSEEKSSPETLLIESEIFRAVDKELVKIEPEQRVSFVLRVFHGKSHQEIAAITGFSISKVKIDIYRTRTRLRKQLSDYLEKSDEV